MYPLVRDLAATGVPVKVICRVLGFTKQGFIGGANTASARDWDDAHLIKAACDVNTDDPKSGHRFTVGELQASGAGRQSVACGDRLANSQLLEAVPHDSDQARVGIVGVDRGAASYSSSVRIARSSARVAGRSSASRARTVRMA